MRLCFWNCGLKNLCLKKSAASGPNQDTRSFFIKLLNEWCKASLSWDAYTMVIFSQLSQLNLFLSQFQATQRPVALPVLVDWRPGRPRPVHGQWGSDTCAAWTLHLLSSLHIHQPVSLSAGPFIINSCWLVKAALAVERARVFIFAAMRPLPWVDLRGREPTLFPWLMDTHLKAQNADLVNLLSLSHTPFLLSMLPHSPPSPPFRCRQAPSATVSGTFCIKSSLSGLRGGGMKMKRGRAWPSAMCVCHTCLAEVEM